MAVPFDNEQPDPEAERVLDELIDKLDFAAHGLELRQMVYAVAHNPMSDQPLPVRQLVLEITPKAWSTEVIDPRQLDEEHRRFQQEVADAEYDRIRRELLGENDSESGPDGS
jgi:hypothetical protein